MKIVMMGTSEFVGPKKKKHYLTMATDVWLIAVIINIINVFVGFSDLLTIIVQLCLIAASALLIADMHQTRQSKTINPYIMKLNVSASEAKDDDEIDGPNGDGPDGVFTFGYTAYAYSHDVMAKVCDKDVDVDKVIQELQPHIDTNGIQSIIWEFIHAIAVQRQWSKPIENFAYNQFKDRDLSITAREVIEYVESRISVLYIVDDDGAPSDLFCQFHDNYNKIEVSDHEKDSH